ncbi:MAG: hypothetical protein IKD66_09970, partial [Solobacterium sp.]|nr:hypothetical protein [Solobacterium sp.]
RGVPFSFEKLTIKQKNPHRISMIPGLTPFPWMRSCRLFPRADEKRRAERQNHISVMKRIHCFIIQ